MNYPAKIKVQFLSLLIGVAAFTSMELKASGEYEISGRLNIVGSYGTPTNDVLGYGFSVHRRLNDDWFLGVNLEHSPEFDFEIPSRIVGIRGTEQVDAVGSMTLLTVVAERRYLMESQKWSWFWNLGGGIAVVDMDDADGDRVGGGTYEIKTSADTELVIVGNLGLIQHLGKNWSARYELTSELHSASWDVEDRISGATGDIDDYEILGLRVGMTYGFD